VAALLRQINNLTPADYKTITLDRPGRYNRPRVRESTTQLSNYLTTLRQFIVTGLGRDAPTVIITNDTDTSAKQLTERYARRMTIGQRLAEIIRAFRADALSSAVNLNVDLDLMLCVLAQALIAALRARLPGYPATPPSPPTSSNAASSKPRPVHHHRRHHHRPPRPTCLLTRRPPSRPTPNRPVVGQPHRALRIRLTLAPTNCAEIRVKG
jgi:hypothetical protein